MHPRIAVNASYLPQSYQQGWSITVKADYTDAILTAGGAPFILPTTGAERAETLRETLAQTDGLVLTGGHDLSARRYGIPQHPKAEVMHPRREEFDFLLLKEALDLDLPVLGICLGCQLINVCYGGSLYQHLPEDRPDSEVRHRQERGYAAHPVEVGRGALLEKILGAGPLFVNSGHHQAIRDLGKGLVASAWSQDGLIEAVEDPAKAFVLGVQWHPEAMTADAKQSELLRAFVRAGEKRTKSAGV